MLEFWFQNYAFQKCFWILSLVCMLLCIFISYYIMKKVNGSNDKYFPNGNKKDMNSIFELIKLKKIEFSRNLEMLEKDQIIFPNISHLKQEDNGLGGTDKNLTLDDLEKQAIRFQKKEIVGNSESNQPLTSNIFSSSIKTDNNKKLSESRKINIFEVNMIKNKVSRTKTEFNPHLQRKKNTNTTNATNTTYSGQKVQQQSFLIDKIDQIKEHFCLQIQKVPKIMKQRNQDNLSLPLNYLEQFNPFFNRNQRIINICLLKVGKVLHRDSPFLLYKSGQQLDYFYIIMIGKIKIIDGMHKRICQTGETVLQQTIFTEKPKKISLERAKVVGSTYLLEIKIDQYKKLKEQLIRYGLKQGFQSMQAIIKRNYIIKSWMRNKKSINKYMK